MAGLLWIRLVILMIWLAASRDPSPAARWCRRGLRNAPESDVEPKRSLDALSPDAFDPQLNVGQPHTHLSVAMAQHNVAFWMGRHFEPL